MSLKVPKKKNKPILSKFEKATTMFEKSETLRPKIENFKPKQNEPDAWIKSFEIVVKDVCDSDNLDEYFFALLPFFLETEDSIWFYSERVNQMSWKFFKEIFTTKYWQIFWKATKDANSRKKEPNESFKDFFDAKIQLYKESCPEMSDYSILKNCISSLNEDEVDYFQNCLNFQIEHFMQYVSGMDIRIAADAQEAAEQVSDNDDDEDNDRETKQAEVAKTTLTQNVLDEFLKIIVNITKQK